MAIVALSIWEWVTGPSSEKGEVVVVMTMYTHSSFPKGKDWRSDPYTLLPLLGKGLVVIMARYLVPPLATRDWW